MRVGEVTLSNHVLRAKKIHVGCNKDKLLVILYSSKTHDKSVNPQEIKICANKIEKSGKYRNRHFCPFEVINTYMKFRKGYLMEEEPFFIFKDYSLVKPDNGRQILKAMIRRLNLDPKLYGFHSLRIGRSSDLIKFGYPVEKVQRMGRWKSNVGYKYIRTTLLHIHHN